MNQEGLNSGTALGRTTHAANRELIAARYVVGWQDLNH